MYSLLYLKIECLPSLEMPFLMVSMMDNFSPTLNIQFQSLHHPAGLSMWRIVRSTSLIPAGRHALMFHIFQQSTHFSLYTEPWRTSCSAENCSQAPRRGQEVLHYHPLWCSKNHDWERDEGGWSSLAGEVFQCRLLSRYVISLFDLPSCILLRTIHGREWEGLHYSLPD